MFGEKKTIVKATINGKVVTIDLAHSKDKNAYNDIKDKIEYLGEGLYHSYDGFPATDKNLTHFWRFKK